MPTYTSFFRGVLFLVGAVSCAMGAAGTPRREEMAGAAFYDRVVGPLLQARCAECHGEQKQKAKLALHSWEGLERGSDAGPVVVAGKPKDSSLLERMRLPLSDEEHMPPEKKPQPSPEEITLLSHWIAAGASRTATLSDLSLPDSSAEFASRLADRFAAQSSSPGDIESLWDIDLTAVALAREPFAPKVAEIQSRYPGALTYESRTATTLIFSALGLGKSFGNEDLESLLPLAEVIRRLDISQTSVTDQCAPLLARFRHLRALRAVNNDLGDTTVAALVPLQSLEKISLFGTNVTAASLPVIKRIPSLKIVLLGLMPSVSEGQARDRR